MLLGRACRKMFIHNKPLRLSSKNKGEKQSQSNMNKAITSRCHLAISLFRDHFKTVLPVQYTENDNGNILCCAHWWLLWWGFNCEVAFKKLTKLTISFSLSLLSFRKLLFFFFPKIFAHLNSIFLASDTEQDGALLSSWCEDNQILWHLLRGIWVRPLAPGELLPFFCLERTVQICSNFIVIWHYLIADGLYSVAHAWGRNGYSACVPMQHNMVLICHGLKHIQMSSEICWICWSNNPWSILASFLLCTYCVEGDTVKFLSLL